MDHVKQVKSRYIWIDKDILDLVDPFIHLALAVAHYATFLVCPMRSDTFFCDFVHPAAADLYLDPDTGVAHEGTVQSLVTIVLRMIYPVANAVVLIMIKTCDK